MIVNHDEPLSSLGIEHKSFCHIEGIYMINISHIQSTSEESQNFKRETTVKNAGTSDALSVWSHVITPGVHYAPSSHPQNLNMHW